MQFLLTPFRPNPLPESSPFKQKERFDKTLATNLFMLLLVNGETGYYVLGKHQTGLEGHQP